MKPLLLPLVLILSGPSTAAQELDIGREIRPSIRWLRSVQDVVSGRYGDGAEATALALRAFAECPDHYRSADGPFVSKGITWLLGQQWEDGSICDEDATPEERRDQTRLATQALLGLSDESTVDPVARALRFLDEDADAWETAKGAEDLEAALARSRELLSKRAEEGWWDGPRGKVIETAESVLELAVVADRVQPPEAEPQPVSELPGFAPADRAAVEAAALRGAAFLNQLADERGRFGMPGSPDAGLTAMAVAALATLPEPRPEPIQGSIDKGLAWLATLQRGDGSIHDGKLANYITSAAILAFVRSGEPEYEDTIAAASRFLQGLQLDQDEGYSEGDVYYGGIGYGSTERPDLSNLQMALEALARSGLEQGAPTYAKALKFLERTQNRSESNDVRIVQGEIVISSGDDGGAAYRPGDSKAGFIELADGTQIPRSYGSMTYALLKCFVFAGVPRDDPRMQAAWEWCSRNYTLDVNPGFEHLSDPSAAYQGLFYYFNTMARALDAYGEDVVVDAAGQEHAWRNELCGRIMSMQSKIDGSWLNRNSPRWYEGNPLLASAYALLTLDVAMPKAE